MENSCTVNFRIHYHANYGDSIYLLGSYSIPHQWKVYSGLKFEWQQGDYWTASLKICNEQITLNSKLEYKFCIANSDYPLQECLLWEEGPNRTIKLIPNSILFLQVYWNYQSLTEQRVQQVKVSLSQILVQKKQLEQVIQNRLNSQQDKSSINIQAKEQVNSQLKESLKQLDPTINASKIDNKVLSFYQEYAIIELEQKNPQIIEQMEKKTKECKLKIEQRALQNNDKNNLDLPLFTLFKYYESEGINLQLNDQNPQQQEYTVAEQYQQQMVSSGVTQNLKYLQLKFQDTQDFSYEKIELDQNLKNEIIQSIKKSIAIDLNVSPDQVIILNIKKGSIYIELVVKDVDQLEKKSFQSFQNLGLPTPIVKIKSLLDTFTLDQRIFDPRFNMNWTQDGSDIRGKLFFKSLNKYVPQPYNFPKGYLGYGLNIAKWMINNDQKWLNQDQDSWIVLYHGTRTYQAITGIINDKIRPGPANACGGSQCRITGEIIASGSNVNTYLADNVGPSGSDGYASPIQIGGKYYKMIFQCRVNPLAVRSPTGCPTYYTIEDSKYDVKENIRPYRLLIKQV